LEESVVKVVLEEMGAKEESVGLVVLLAMTQAIQARVRVII